MKIRSESFNANLPDGGSLTFYAVATDPALEGRLEHDGTSVKPWFFRFTGVNKDSLENTAHEIMSGERGSALPADQVKMFKVTIEEVPICSQPTL